MKSIYIVSEESRECHVLPATTHQRLSKWLGPQNYRQQSIRQGVRADQLRFEKKFLGCMMSNIGKDTRDTVGQ